MPAARPRRTSSPADRVVAAARKAGVRLVRFLYTDNGGVTRGKAHARREPRAPHDRRHRPDGGHAGDEHAGPAGLVDGLGPGRRDPPGARSRAPSPCCPMRRNAAAMTWTCSSTTAPRGGRARAASSSGRSRAVRRGGLQRTRGLRGRVHAGRAHPDGGFAPLDESLCFSAVGMTTAAPVIDAIVAAFEAQGIQVDQFYPGVGHGQQEMSIRHAPALWPPPTARSTTARPCAASPSTTGCTPRSRPSPSPSRPATARTCTSACGTRAGRRPLMHDPRGRLRPEQAGHHFIGRRPATTCRRCSPSPARASTRTAACSRTSWASAYTSWGPDNREAAVRVPSTLPVGRGRLDQRGAEGLGRLGESLSRPRRAPRRRPRRRQAPPVARRARAGRPGPPERRRARGAGTSGACPARWRRRSTGWRRTRC